MRKLVLGLVVILSVCPRASAQQGAGADPLEALVSVLGETDDAGVQLDLLRGMGEGLKGKRSVKMPASWPAAYDKLRKSPNEEVRHRAQAIAITFGDPRALEDMRAVLADSKAKVEDRRDALEALLGAKDAKLAPVLQQLVSDPAMRGRALQGLAAYEDPKTPQVVLNGYKSFDPAERRDALNTLSSRLNYAKEMMAAVDKGTVPRADLSAAVVRQLSTFDNAEINTWIGKVWGVVRSTADEKVAEINRWKTLITPTRLNNADPVAGRAIYAKTCMQCHTLFGVGGKVGPDLTGSNRAELDYILQNVIDPSAVIGKDYLVNFIHTKDKRTINAIIKSEDANQITLMTENETIVLPKSEVTSRKESPVSMMPEGLLAAYDARDVFNLVRYLQSPSQVPLAANAENAKLFFNGKDLTLWEGDAALWRVENGEIVGKTTGLKKNNFLVSHMQLKDFRLTLKIKLVGKQGNSGIQFRSEPLPSGEMKGYQADVGTGWWGKLYEESGRGLLAKEGGEKWVKPGDWNTYEILAVGSHVWLAINGHVTCDLEDRDGAPKGVSALQLHSGGATEVRFKDLVLEVDPKPQLTTVAEGK